MPAFNIENLERVLGGEYIKYYAVNNALAPVAPFGIGGQPLTLDDAKHLYNQLKAKNPNVIYSIDEAKLHISFFTGYEHLHPYNDCQNMAILATNKATSDDPFTVIGGKE